MKNLFSSILLVLFVVSIFISCESEVFDESVSLESIENENTHSTDKGQVRPIGSDLPDEDEDSL